jgi:hypothetical protein
VLPAVHQQANTLTTRLGITQDNPKRLKKTFHIPHGISNLTMKKNVIRKLSILFAHNTSIYHNDVSLTEIVNGNDFS